MTTSPNPAIKPLSLRLTWALWGILFLVMATIVGLHPETHTVTPEYRGAAEKWIHSEDIYQLLTIHGFLYSPAAALLYIPILPFPLSIGEILWRAITLSTFLTALWKLAEAVLAEDRDRLFWLISLLSLPACFASIRNGQTNLPLAACFIHAAVDLSRCRWNQAAAWLSVAFILKPIALVMILLAFAFYPPSRWRLALGIFLVVLLPWLRFDWAYVWHEHVLFIQKMQIASNPKVDTYNDLRGLLLSMHIEVDSHLLTLLRLSAAGCVFFLCRQCFLKKTSPIQIAFLIAGLSASYLMIFNPRTETNSYIILAPFIAALAVRKKYLENQSDLWLLLVILTLLLGSDGYGPWIFHATNYWLKPVTAIIFLFVLVSEIFRPTSWHQPPTTP